MSSTKRTKILTFAISLAFMTVMFSTQAAGAQQRQQRQKQRQQRQSGWQPEVRGQPGNAGSRAGNNSWRRGLWTRMSNEEKDQIYDFIETHFPRMLTELEHLRNANPKRFENRMNRVVVEVQQAMEMIESHPRRGALHIQERKLEMELRFNIAKYRRHSGANEKRRLASAMEKLIGQIFDTQTQRQQLEVKELENRLDELIQRIKQRQAHRQDFIEKHLNRVRHDPGDQDGPPDREWLGEPSRP